MMKPTTQIQFDHIVKQWGLKHFAPSELRFLGASNSRLKNNHLPPIEMVENIKEVALAADAIREAFGLPVRVLSGFRSPAYNRSVGGSKGSYHMQFRALDLAPVANTPQNVRRLAGVATMLRPQKWKGGIGRYHWGIHIDNGKIRDF